MVHPIYKRGTVRVNVLAQTEQNNDSQGSTPVLSIRNSFLISEEQKRRKTFFSHPAGSLGSSAWGRGGGGGGGFRSPETFTVHCAFAIRHCLACVFCVVRLGMAPSCV